MPGISFLNFFSSSCQEQGWGSKSRKAIRGPIAAVAGSPRGRAIRNRRGRQKEKDLSLKERQELIIKKRLYGALWQWVTTLKSPPCGSAIPHGDSLALRHAAAHSVSFTRGEDDSEKGEGEEGKWLERKKNEQQGGKKQRFSNENTKKSFSAHTHSHTLIHPHTHTLAHAAQLSGDLTNDSRMSCSWGRLISA